jgi:hypothetical protein
LDQAELDKRGVFFRGCRQEMLIGQFNKELEPGRLQARRMRKSRGLARGRITIARRPGSQRKLKNG